MISDEKFLKREHILKTRQFRAAYKKGASFRQGGVTLYALPNNLGHNRLGFSISSKKVRLATMRNRTKRLLREAYRKNKKNLKNGFDMVLVVKKDLSKNPFYKDAESLLLKLAKAAGILL